MSRETNMIDPMGIFRTDIEIAALHDAGRKRDLIDVMVDTGSEYNWVPAGILHDFVVRRGQPPQYCACAFPTRDEWTPCFSSSSRWPTGMT